MAKGGATLPPQNDVAALFALTFVSIAVVKTFELLQSRFKRNAEKRKKQASGSQDVLWEETPDNVRRIAASGLANPKGEPEEQDYSIWSSVHVMEKRSIKDKHDRQHQEAKIKFYK